MVFLSSLFIARRPIRKRERRAITRPSFSSLFGNAPRDIGAIVAQWRNEQTRASKHNTMAKAITSHCGGQS